MNAVIELPEDIFQVLESEWGDVPRRTLEGVAAEGYRSGVLTESRIRRMLALESRFDTRKRLGILPGGRS